MRFNRPAGHIASVLFLLRFVCRSFGWKCSLFLESVAFQWLHGLGKLEEFEAEVILGFLSCSSS
jgi:hypothetical protein